MRSKTRRTKRRHFFTGTTRRRQQRQRRRRRRQRRHRRHRRQRRQRRHRRRRRHRRPRTTTTTATHNTCQRLPGLLLWDLDFDRRRCKPQGLEYFKYRARNLCCPLLPPCCLCLCLLLVVVVAVVVRRWRRRRRVSTTRMSRWEMATFERAHTRCVGGGLGVGVRGEMGRDTGREANRWN